MIDKEDPIPLILTVLEIEHRPLSISSIARQTGLNRHTVAQHLEVLRVSGQIKQIRQGMAKKYYLSERSFPGPFTAASPDLIIILDQAGEIFYVNDSSAPGINRGQETTFDGNTLGTHPHPVIHHPDFFTHVRMASSHKVVHVTLVVPGERGDLHYPVTVTRVGIPHGGQGTLIIIEGAANVEDSLMPLGREVIEQLIPGFVVVDLSGKILYVNPSFLLSTGHPDVTLLLGQDIENVLHTDLHLNNILEQKGIQIPPFQENTLTRADGVQVFYLMHWEIVRSTEGIPLYLSGIMLDISGRRELSEKIATLDKRYQNIVENTPDIIWETDADLRYTYISPAISKVTGFLSQEMVGTTPSWLSKPPGGEEERRMILKDPISLPPSIVRQHTLQHWDGHQICIETRATPVFSSKGEFSGLLGIDRDITEGKRVEEALIESEEQYRQIFDNVLIGLYRSSVEGRFIQANRHAAHLLGYDSPEDLIGSITDIGTQVYHDVKDREKVKVLLTEQGFFKDFEMLFRRKDGSIIWGSLSAKAVRDKDGTILYFEGMSMDINDRKLAEEALRESEQRLIAAQRIAKFGDISWDVETGEITWSDALYDLIQYDKSEKIDFDRVNREIHHPDDLKRVTKWLNDCITSGSNEITPNEYRIIRKDGKVLFVRTMGVIERGEVGQVKVFVTLQDITERKQTEEALRKSEKNYQSIFNNAVMGIYQVSRDGRFLSANNHAAQILGYESAEELIQMVTDIDTQIYKDPKTREVGKRILLEKGVLENFEVPCRHKDGKTVWVSFNARLVRDADGNILYHEGTSQDITRRKQVEEALRESEEKLALVMDGVPVLICLIDADLRYVYVNKAYENWYGQKRQEIIGKQIPDLMDKVVFERVLPHYQNVLSGKAVSYEICNYDGRGKECFLSVRYIPYYIQGKVAGFFASMLDITNRKTAEEALRDNEEKYRSLAKQVHDGIYIYQGDRFIFSNTLVSEITGYSPEELLTMPFIDLVHPDDRAYIQDIAERRGRGEPVPTRYESRIIHKDGTVRHVDLAVSIVPYRGGYAALGAARDITERKLAQEALCLANSKLNRLNAITRHDILNHLTVLQGYIELARCEIGDTHSSVDFLDQACAASTRIFKTINFTREYQQIGSSLPTWYVIDTLIHNAANDAQLGDIKVESLIPPGLSCYADPLVAKVFYNLMDNAVRYGGKKITQVRFSAEERDGALVVICEDDGFGILPNEKEKIFSKGYGKNTGFGLFLSREILDITGITIHETGDPGKRARFEIVVPKGAWRRAGDGA